MARSSANDCEVGVMNRYKAEKRIKRKILKVKPCPFCGKIPEVSVRCDSEHSGRGSWGHYVDRAGCCSATKRGCGDLFFCSDFDPPNYRLWWSMLNMMVDDWNTRINT